MANSTTNLDLISQSQAQKEVTANALFDAASPATLFGRRAAGCVALTWGYYGGVLMIAGVPTTIPNGTVALPANSAAVYIEATPAGVVSQNAIGFTVGNLPLYKCATGAAAVTSWIDCRIGLAGASGLPTMAGQGGKYLRTDGTAYQWDAISTTVPVTMVANAAAITITDSGIFAFDITGTLTAAGNITATFTFANTSCVAIFDNLTTGAFTLTVAGIYTLPAGKSIWYWNGTLLEQIGYAQSQLGTMAAQNANAVAVTGGAINSTSIGATTPSTGSFTSLSSSSIANSGVTYMGAGGIQLNSTGINVGSVAWIGGNSSTSSWLYNVPTGGSHTWGINNGTGGAATFAAAGATGNNRLTITSGSGGADTILLAGTQGGMGMSFGSVGPANLYRANAAGTGIATDGNMTIVGRTLLAGAVDDGVTALQVNGAVKASSLQTTQTPTASATASTHSIPIVVGGVTYYMRLSTTP